VANALIVKHEGSVAVVTLNRPDKLNALNAELLAELQAALDATENDPSIRALVFTGAGEKAFVVGADISELAALDTIGAYELMLSGHKVLLRIHEFPKPVIAMVNGYALGGGFELALACHLIVASERAVFGFPEINLNTMPGWGGTQFAARKMGPNRAMEMVLTGNHYPARTCWDFGFINRLVAPEALYDATMELAGILATKQPFALKIAKSAIQRGAEVDIATGLRLEAQAYAVNFSGAHTRAGFDAFLNRKRRT